MIVHARKIVAVRPTLATIIPPAFFAGVINAPRPILVLFVLSGQISNGLNILLERIGIL